MPLQFGELPPGRVSLHDAWKAEVKELQARPGEWALLTTKNTDQQARNLVSLIQRGMLRAFRPAGAFEGARRGKDVWVRYVGEDQS